MIERLTSQDVRHNVALARAVGWFDVEGDWRVLHDSAVVLGVRHHDGRLIAQGALGLYGAAGTIAKMIVAPDYRNQRIGARLLDALLREADDRSIGLLGLVATPAGRLLYQGRQFAPVGEIVVLQGKPEPTTSTHPAPAMHDGDAAVRFESRWISCSRENMLRARFREAVAAAWVRGTDDRVRGYALATAQGPLGVIGPVMAETEEDACTLTSSLFRSLGGAQVRIDVPAEQRGFCQWLERIGLREQGIRVEMARGAFHLPWQIPQRFALATQAWG